MIAYTIILTETQNKALGYVAYSQQGWIDNMTNNRCRIAIDEIVQICVAKCLETGTPIPGTKDGMVDLAFAEGWVVPAADRTNTDPIATQDTGSV